MDVLITVLFGTRRTAVGWIAEQTVAELPTVGLPVRIRVGEDDDNVMEGQVYRAWPETIGEAGGLFIYGGPSLPSAQFIYAMECADWEPVSEDGVAVLVEAVQSTPAIAAVHEVTLLVGDPADGLAVFQRTLRPRDPALPLFAQRLRLEALIDYPAEYLDDDEQDDNDGSVTARRDGYLADIAKIEADIESPATIDGISDGLPVITVYSAMERTGFGKVVFWTPGLGNVAMLDLLANDWAPLQVPGDFDPVHFRVARRIDLAKRTSLTFEESDYGTLVIQDWDIDDAAVVNDTDHDLIPRLLLEHCRAEMEFRNIDAMLDEWAHSSSDDAPPCADTDADGASGAEGDSAA